MVFKENSATRQEPRNNLEGFLHVTFVTLLSLTFVGNIFRQNSRCSVTRECFVVLGHTTLIEPMFRAGRS